MTTRRKFFAAIGAALGVPVLAGDTFLVDKQGDQISAIRNGRTIWFVDRARVNINDLIAPVVDGKIVRVDGDPHECVMVYDIEARKEVEPRSA